MHRKEIIIDRRIAKLNMKMKNDYAGTDNYFDLFLFISLKKKFFLKLMRHNDVTHIPLHLGGRSDSHCIDIYHCKAEVKQSNHNI